MQVTVLYYGLMKQVVGLREENVDLSGPARIDHLLAALAARHGAAFQAAIYGEDGAVRPEVVIILGGRNVLTAGGVQTPLPAGGRAEIVLLGPAVTGGES